MGHLITKSLPKKAKKVEKVEKAKKAKKAKKVEKVEKIKKKISTECTPDAPKRGRGRPKGSTNKNGTKAKVKKVKKVKKKISTECDNTNEPKKGRGRPKGSRNRRDAQNRKKLTPKQLREQRKKDLMTVNVGRFLGYCNGCQGMISHKEMVSMKIIVCKACGLRSYISKLETEKQREAKALSKKEYLENGINIDYHDMPELKPDIPVNIDNIPNP